MTDFDTEYDDSVIDETLDAAVEDVAFLDEEPEVESATATRSPSRIILKRVTASPTLRNSVFWRSKSLLYGRYYTGVRCGHSRAGRRSLTIK